MKKLLLFFALILVGLITKAQTVQIFPSQVQFKDTIHLLETCGADTLKGMRLDFSNFPFGHPPITVTVGVKNSSDIDTVQYTGIANGFVSQVWYPIDLPYGDSDNQNEYYTVEILSFSGGVNPVKGADSSFVLHTIDRTNNIPNNAPATSYGNYEYIFDFSTYNTTNGETMQTIAYRGLNDTIELIPCLDGNCDGVFVGNNVSNTMAVENLTKLSTVWGIKNFGTLITSARKVKINDPSKLASFVTPGWTSGSFAGNISGSCNALPDTVVVQNGMQSTVATAPGGGAVYTTPQVVQNADTANSGISMVPAPPTYTFAHNEQVWKNCAFCPSVVQINALLPVTFLSWKAYKQKQAVRLEWIITHEVNCKQYDVQHSTNGASWRTLNSIPSKSTNGNSNQELHYAYLDNQPSIGHNYYRLAQVDIDGKVNYTKVLDIVFNGEGSIIVYPNPAQNELTVEINSKKSTKQNIALIDISGRIVYQEQLNIPQGNSIHKINLSDFASGIYSLHVGSQVLRVSKLD